MNTKTKQIKNYKHHACIISIDIIYIGPILDTKEKIAIIGNGKPLLHILTSPRQILGLIIQ